MRPLLLAVACAFGALAASGLARAAPHPATVVDTPAWPSSPADPTLTLTWVVYPARPDPAHPDLPEVARRHVELVVRIGAVARRIDLGSEFGHLFGLNQSVCQGADAGAAPYEKERGEVAKMTFYMGGAGGFVARRRTPDTLEILAWSQSDGACPDGKGDVTACPVSRLLLASVPIPAGARVREAMVIVEGVAKEHPFACDKDE